MELKLGGESDGPLLYARAGYWNADASDGRHFLQTFHVAVGNPPRMLTIESAGATEPLAILVALLTAISRANAMTGNTIPSEPTRGAVKTSGYAPVWMHNLLGFVTGSFPANPEWKAIFAKHIKLLIDDHATPAPDPQPEVRAKVIAALYGNDCDPGHPLGDMIDALVSLARSSFATPPVVQEAVRADPDSIRFARQFADMYRSGAQGAEMDYDAAQALALAIDDILSALSPGDAS